MKVYIRGMATGRKQARLKIESLSGNIEDNIIKLCIFENNQRDKQHWIDELATWFNDINKISLKPKNSKFSWDEYDEWVFGGFGTAYSDSRVALHVWQINNRQTQKYPDIDVTKSDVDRVFAVASQLRERFNDIFSTRNEYNRADFLRIIEAIIDE